MLAFHFYIGDFFRQELKDAANGIRARRRPAPRRLDLFLVRQQHALASNRRHAPQPEIDMTVAAVLAGKFADKDRHFDRHHHHTVRQFAY